MTLFYMHMHSVGAATQVDHEGYRRSSLESMRAEAFHGARALMSGNILKGLSPQLQSSFDITDEAGGLLLNVRFADTLDGTMPVLEPRTSWDS